MSPTPIVWPPEEEPTALVFCWLSADDNALAAFVSDGAEWIAIPPRELAGKALAKCHEYITATSTTQGKITLRQFAAQLFPNDQDPSSKLPLEYSIVPLNTYLVEVDIPELNFKIRSELKKQGYDVSHWSIP
jgi:hypothetical protein